MAEQQLDHTIFIVGWKTEEVSGLPVWIARNSYGDSWGMSADFYVRLGYNDFGIESEVSAYDVELLV
jgi:C1A family cysteine protease